MAPMPDTSETRLFTDPAVIAAHLEAARKLVNDTMVRMRAQEPETAADVQTVASRGGFFVVQTAMSPAGMVAIDIKLVAPDGQSVQMARVEFDETSVH